MSTKDKPNEEPKQAAAVDKVAATFAATEKSLADIETRAATAKREVRELSETHARAQEERQRSAAQWDYEEDQRRRAVKDAQATEDRERARTNAEREATLAAREKAINETLAELLGVTSNPFVPKDAKAALDKKLDDAEKKGKAIAEKSAASDYATKKSIDDANTEKRTALLDAENARLKADNAKLETECKRLSEVNTDLAKRQGDLARDAFGSAGGIQRQAMDSLQSAAQNAPRAPGR